MVQIIGSPSMHLATLPRHACHAALKCGAQSAVIVAGNELLAVHRLNAPSTLNTTLLNTNCIENSFRNVRAKIRRVTRWRAETQMASKWMAYALLEAERGFRKINHSKELVNPASILESMSPPPPEEGEKPSPPSSPLDSILSTEYKS